MSGVIHPRATIRSGFSGMTVSPWACSMTTPSVDAGVAGGGRTSGEGESGGDDGGEEGGSSADVRARESVRHGAPLKRGEWDHRWRSRS
jgi:hypothetical protein